MLGAYLHHSNLDVRNAKFNIAFDSIHLLYRSADTHQQSIAGASHG